MATVEEQTNELLENPNSNILEGDAFRKSAFDGGSAIYPYGKDGQEVYLNDPNIQEEFKEDLFQKHLEFSVPKKVVEEDPFENIESLQDVDDIFASQVAEKTRKDELDTQLDILGKPKYVNQFNNNQVQILRKNGINQKTVQKLIENNFFLPFERETGAVSDADKTVGMFTIADGIWDNYAAFVPNLITGSAMKNSQQRIEAINMAIAGREDELSWQYGFVKNKTLEELDIMRGQEQVQLEMFSGDKIPTSTEWWQNRIREQGGIEMPLTVLEELKKDAGGFVTKTTGYAVDFAPVAGVLSFSMYKNAITKYAGFAAWAKTFKKSKSYKKGMSEDDLVNAFIKERYPAMDATKVTQSGNITRWWQKGQIKTGMEIRTSKEFIEKSKKLGEEIVEANKRHQQGLVNFKNGKIDKQHLIRLTDEVRDLKFRQLSYNLKGVPKIFKQDAAMELGFAAGAVTISEVWGDRYEFLGGITGGVVTGLTGNWVLNVGKTGYHVGATWLDWISKSVRDGSLGFEGNMMRLKPEILRNTKVWDKDISDYREISPLELKLFERHAYQLSQGGEDVTKHIKANIENYNSLIDRMTPVLGTKNIHMLHEEFAIISMLGPMMAARDAAKVSNTSLTSLFDTANPEFLDSLKKHQYMIGALQEVLEKMSNATSRSSTNKGGQEFLKIQTAISDFANQSTMDTTKEFQGLLNDSKNFFENLGDVTHPMWDDSEALYQNLDRMDNFFKLVEDNPVLSTMINKKEYQGMVDDIMFYREGVDVINQQITLAIKNVEKSTLPDSQKLETMSNWLAKSLVMNERLHYKQANKPFKALYKKYKNAEVDGFNLFEDFWKVHGKNENVLKSIEVFWRGNKNSPREFSNIKLVFDEAADRQIRKMHAIDRTPAYLDTLSPNLKELEYDKWLKEKQFALAEQLSVGKTSRVSPSTIDSMTLFEWLRHSVKTADGKSVELIFNIQELNKLRGGFQRVEFALSKQNDPQAGVFKGLVDSTENLIDDLSLKYKDVYPNLKTELEDAREIFKYTYANRYLDKTSDTGRIGANWISYSQLGKEFTHGPYAPGGRTFQTHPTKWIDFNKVKKNPELFRDQIAMNIGDYIPGQGYVINPGSKGWLMWQLYATRLIDDSIAKEIRNNSAKFLNGTYRILDGKVADQSGQAINTFNDLYIMANKLSFDVQGGGKIQLYNVDKLVNNEKSLIEALTNNKTLREKMITLKNDLVSRANTEGAVIRKANAQSEQAILNQVKKLSPGIDSVENFVKHFIGGEESYKSGLELTLLGETLIKQGAFKSTKEFNLQVANMVGDYVTMKYGGNVGGVSIVKGKSKQVQDFNFEGLRQFLDTNKVILTDVLDAEHLDFLKASTELFSIIQRDMLKVVNKSAPMVYPGGLGPPAILSRIYGVARGVIGLRFVASELTIRAMHKGRGDFIKEMIKNKDAARVINEILERGSIDRKLDRDFSRALQAAYIETAIIEPESEKMKGPPLDSLLNYIRIPFTDTSLGSVKRGIGETIKAPATFLESRDVDMSQQEQYQTLFPEGTDDISKETFSDAYTKSPVDTGLDAQMNRLQQ
jgi:hypothetical protein